MKEHYAREVKYNSLKHEEFPVFLFYGDGIIGIFEIYRCYKTSRSDKLEGSMACFHFEMMVMGKLIK